MRILVTGHLGYIGAVLTPLLADAGHDVVGLDSGLFADATLGPHPPDVPTLSIDVRDVRVEDLDGFDAVLHLAGISKRLLPAGSFLRRRAVFTARRAKRIHRSPRRPGFVWSHRMLRRKS